MVIDGGGRGAVLVHKYSSSPYVSKIIVIPGNDLMQLNSAIPVKTYQEIKTTSIKEIIGICVKEKADLVDVAQDSAIAAGLVDELIKVGVKVVGPSRNAGRIEWDKAWARKFMEKYSIPHPKFKICKSQKEGIDFVKKNRGSWFVKASGLAEGKGAIPAANADEAVKAIKQMEKFGSAGKIYLLEEWLIGEEFSAFALADGRNYQIIGFAQDHKRVNDGDLGDNTGGMGCVSNPLIINSKIKKQAERIISKALNGLRREKRPYKGVLYLGGIVVKGKVYVIEFNARWGDPEAEVLLPSIRNDLFLIGQAIAKGDIKKIKIKPDKKIRVAIAGTSKGYPGNYSRVKGKKIFGLDEAGKVDGVVIYGAGTIIEHGKHFADGGRLFYVVGEGNDVLQARDRAYEAMEKVSIEGNNLHFRTDIGWRDAQRLRK